MMARMTRQYTKYLILNGPTARLLKLNGACVTNVTALSGEGTFDVTTTTEAVYQPPIEAVSQPATEAV